jgi:2'-hydroxyisoflavone reductase
MKILILGGTKFVGRTLTQTALDAGHEVTLFTRGETNPDLFPEAEKLRGNRDGDLGALEGRTWDVAIDTCGYFPRVVEQSVRLLADAVEHYSFVSSISVYAEDVYTKPNTDEDGSLAHLVDESVEEVTPEFYGGLKALCEAKAEEIMPGRVFVPRPGLIVGPYDQSDRWTYWTIKIARGGEVLAPPLDSPAQYIDVRDLAEWMIRMAEARKTGVYNATGPDYALSFGAMLESCRTAVGSGAAEIIPVSEEFALENEIQPWSDFPLWLPSTHDGMTQVSVQKAIDDGLTFRSVEETAHDTLTWYSETRGLESQLAAGLSDARENELLAKWRSQE